MKLMGNLLLDWIIYHFFHVNQCQSILIIFYYCFKWKLVKTYHLVLDGVSSTLVFIAEILTPKLGMRPKTNFNIFLLKWRFCINWTFFKSEDTMESSKLWCLPKWWVSYPSDASLSDSELKSNFAETYSGFPLRVTFYISFCFLFHWTFFSHKIAIYLLSVFSSNKYSSPSWVTLFLFFIFLLNHLGFWSVFATQVFPQVYIDCFCLVVLLKHFCLILFYLIVYNYHQHQHRNKIIVQLNQLEYFPLLVTLI